MDLSQFTISGAQDRTDLLKLQNERLIRLRWFYITLLPWVGALVSYFAGSTQLAKDYFFLGVIGITLNAVLYVLCKIIPKRAGFYRVFMVFQLLVDLTVATIATYLSGGPQSRTTAIYIIPILAAGLIFSSPAVYLAAVMSGAAYIMTIFLYNSGPGSNMPALELLTPAIFYPLFYLLIAKLIDYLSHQAQEDTRENAYDSFLAFLSHQLKHPISTTNSIIDYLEHSSSKTFEKDRVYIEMLKSENQNLSILLNNLLESASPAKNPDEDDETDLPKLVQQVAYYCAEKNSRIDDLKLNLVDMTFKVIGSGESLKTALANILDNAFLYSEQGTQVTVKLEKVKNNALIVITDQGPGIDKEIKKKLFKKFSVGKSGKQGIQSLGLGLYVANKIIKTHYGSMHVVTDKTGTKVIITLKRGTKHG